jgi:hypothetical protein
MINGKVPDVGKYGVYPLTGYQDPKGCMQSSNQSPEWYFDVTNWTNGSYEFSFYTVDSSGRASATVTRSFAKT